MRESPGGALQRLRVILCLLLGLALAQAETACRFGQNRETRAAAERAEHSSLYERYPDGVYMAKVTYFNPRTGTRNTYALPVTVDGGTVTQINFPNGGWLDEHHSTPADLDENGEAELITERGYHYSVRILPTSGRQVRGAYPHH